MFCLLIKALFIVLCAHFSSSFFSLNRLFWGDLNCSDNPVKDNRKIEGKSLRDPVKNFTKTCSRNMFTSLVDVNLLPAKLAGYTNKKFVYMCNK